MNRLWPTAVWVAVAVSAFQLAYGLPNLSFLVVLYLLALIQLAGSGTWRMAFYSGLAVGLGIAAIQLGFFWTVFGAGAVALWLVFAFWVGFFVALARAALLRFGRLWGSLAVPVVWCGVEYFRSELYYLRFSWLSPGLAFGPMVGAVPAAAIGGYGIGFILAAIAAASVALWRECVVRGMSILVLGTAGFFVLGQLPWEKVLSPKAAVAVAGVQMEFPTEQEVLLRLNEVIHAHPEAELLVLSEYTFTTPVPDKVKTWCRNHHRYLIVGGERPAGGNQFYNTAFVVSPEGDIVFSQEKSVPIQFFRDGLPARQNTPWNSPWGKIGICICYDLSYSRVTDRLVRAGAEALIVPTMDVADWGIRQHRLHARVAPLRAAEYGIPIFRVASSGISQLVDSSGRVTAEAPCPGEGSIIAGRLELKPPGGLPLDRWLAPGATVMTGVLSALLFIQSRPRSRGKPSDGAAQMERIPVASA
ncbi:MAG TPA: nitrilase-related carbon-nitrogen hydrolase [Verrucomicrobiae bacterium]|nr:nitrilase-related carbon-nitrogen hydrolase [Verrucomicrobiae bacterium]